MLAPAIRKFETPATTNVRLKPRSSTRTSAVRMVPHIAPITFARYRKLKLDVEASRSLMNAIMNGNVAPIRVHQGKIESEMIIADQNRYEAEFMSPPGSSQA